jgi:hypothetical protein
MVIDPWPALPQEHQWTIELMEELLAETTDTPEELTARAQELRKEAGSTEIKGYRDAALALADRYEETAAARLAEVRL